MKEHNKTKAQPSTSGIDITDRVKAEKELQESEQRFRTLVEQAPFGIEIFNADGLQTQVNKAWQTTWDVDSEDTVGKYNVLKDAQLRKLDVFPLIERLFAGEAVDFPDTEVDSSKTGWAGKKRWIRTRGYPVRDQSGRIINLVLFHEDITDRKQAEEVLRRQTQEILELSTPVIQVLEGVLVAPLIGTLDSERTQQFMERLLSAIVETKSRVALVDITGVPTVDTQTAQHLIEAVTAVRLLGAKVVLTGISPPIAQTLVHLGIELSEVTTRSSLAAGLEVAFSDLGLAVIKKNQNEKKRSATP